MTSQQDLFPNTELIKSENVNLKLEQDKHNRDYYFRQILDEEYLWDMRCWFKPKEQYTKEEIKRQILKWMKDDSNGKWNFNCGHCVYCIRRVLDSQWATIDEVVDLVIRNNKVKYTDSIGGWFKGLSDTIETK